MKYADILGYILVAGFVSCTFSATVCSAEEKAFFEDIKVVGDLSKKVPNDGSVTIREINVNGERVFVSIGYTGSGKVRAHVSIFRRVKEEYRRVGYVRFRNWKGKLAVRGEGKHIEVHDVLAEGEKVVLSRINIDVLDF